MTILIEYLNYPFFIRALIVSGLLGILLSWFSSYVVLRHEVLFAHALSNIGFLGVALAILFSLPVTPTLIVSCLCAAAFITFLQKQRLFSNDSLLEICSQMGLALGVIVIAMFPGYRVNIEQFLFGDLLGLTQQDLIITIVASLVVVLVLIMFHKKFLRISLSNTLSFSVMPNRNLVHTLYVFVLAILIALAMKVIGVLLVSVFATIPANFSKLFARNLNETFIISSVMGLVSTLCGFYFSILFDLPSGPVIAFVLGLFWISAVLFVKVRN
jgi:ABC-type Mn2+/Zn2+ transport system permease subunit